MKFLQCLLSRFRYISVLNLFSKLEMELLKENIALMLKLSIFAIVI